MSMPQSNQRGIETSPDAVSAGASAECLNRTSVGLKREIQNGLFGMLLLPQSNQRGIETTVSIKNAPQAIRASIEPAWD